MERKDGQMQGFFQMQRYIFQQETWKRPFDFRLFVWINGNACFKEMEWQGMTLKEGQWVRSLRKLAEDMQFKENNKMKKPSHSQLERALNRLIDDQLLLQEKCEHGLLFTVLTPAEKGGDLGTDLGTNKGTELGNTTKQAEPLGGQSLQDFVERDLGTPLGNGACVEHGTRRIMHLKNNALKEEFHEEEERPKKRVNFFDTFLMAYGKQPTPIQIQKITQWIDQDGLTEELVAWAIEEGAKRSGSFDYLDAILRNCSKENVMTVEQAIQKQEQKQKKKVKPRERNGSRNQSDNAKIDHKKHNFGF